MEANEQAQKRTSQQVQRAEVADLSFRALLQRELLSRCRNNPRYSLRAFARSLEVEPSSLSQIINWKRPLTTKMKERLGRALGLTRDQLAKIPSSERAQTGTSTEQAIQKLAHDTFAVISDWYHYAILELTYIDGFKSDAGWIALRLGISKAQAK